MAFRELTESELLSFTQELDSEREKKMQTNPEDLLVDQSELVVNDFNGLMNVDVDAKEFDSIFENNIEKGFSRLKTIVTNMEAKKNEKISKLKQGTNSNARKVSPKKKLTPNRHSTTKPIYSPTRKSSPKNNLPKNNLPKKDSTKNPRYYEEKYLKYKTKYLQLKKLLGNM